jgi:guanylate kinase
MQEAANEISHKDEFDVIIVNDDFDNALAQLGQVLDDLGTRQRAG